jgi:signal recognition particle GTPase
MKRVEDWKSRLIDLSRKNNLLYFRKTKRGNLTITQPDAQKIFDTLVVKTGRLEFYMPPAPKPTKTEQTATDKSKAKGSTKTKPNSKTKGTPAIVEPEAEAKTAKAPVKAATIEETPKRPSVNQLVLDKLTYIEVDRALKALERRSLLDYRERGVRILYAAFGTLNWVDVETKENVQSPLILVPLEIGKETIRAPYSIAVPPVEDEAVLNPALAAKLYNDYRIDLPSLPEDWEEQTLTDYYRQVEAAVSKMGWKTEASINLGLFSFQKLVIYKDLESNTQMVTQHPIIRAIAGIKEESLIQTGLPEEKDVDNIELPAKTYQVLDADSSQRLSIEYALHGQSFVMKGPPGTGKSQTIANIIAECIANGKSVLFVSDKMAALEVVYKRLSEVGLAHFCLEMHSSKANKQQVVAELKRSLDENLVPRKLPSNHEFDRLIEYRESLNGYVAALHQKRPYLQRSAHEVLSIICSLERVPFIPVGLTELTTLTPQKMRELEELVSHLSKVWAVVDEADFPWVGYRADKYDLEIRSEVLTTLEAINQTFRELELETEDFSARLGVFPPESFTRIQWLIAVSGFLYESPKPEQSWLLSPALDKLLGEARAYLEVTTWIKTTRASLMERYTPLLFELVLTRSQELQQAITNVGKVSGIGGLQESLLLVKREKFLAYLKSMGVMVRKWRETSQALAPMLGLDSEGLTIGQLKQLARMAQLCFAEDKPEPQWFNADYLAEVSEMVGKAKGLYEEHGLLRGRLGETYSEGIYKLNLDDLITKYSGPYQGGIKLFNSEYRNDQKRIAQVTHEGRVPKTVLEDLVDARKVNKLAKRIADSADMVQTLLGRYYHKSRTNFKGAEKAIALTDEIRKLNWATTIPEPLLKILTTPTTPAPMIKNLGEDLQNSVAKWEQHTKDFESLMPKTIPKAEKSLTETSLLQLEEWVIETEKQLGVLCSLTNQTLTVARVEPQSYKHLVEDLKNAESIRKKEAQIIGEKAQLQEKFGVRFQEMQTDWQAIVSVLEWVQRVQGAFGDLPVPEAFAEFAAQGVAAAPSNAELIARRDASLGVLADFEKRFESEMRYHDQKLVDCDMQVIAERIAVLRDRVDDLQVWIDYKDTKTRFILRGLDGFFERLVEQKPPAADLVAIFRKSTYQEWINNLYTEDAQLGKFRRENHEQLIADFKKLDQDLIGLTSAMVIDAANSRKPQDILIQAADAEAGVLSKEAAKKRRLMPLRMLFQKIPNLLVKLKPCLLMSPISVSQFLPPDLKFDLVLFDEASQLVPEDAISAIYRSRTIVVAGDNKQLPPTSFFQKNLIDDKDWDELTDESIEVFDSILDECLGIGLPVKTLKWHYRSRHEGLIAFSNHRFYDDTMITFPSAKAQTDGLGVKLVHVPGATYDRGGNRDNPAEAQKVADLVFEHFKTYPKKTLGVVTFSIAQMEAVEEAIERRLKEHPEFEHFFKEDRIDGFFVKNLENVQGDERDVILFSVGYGYDQNGQITMNFGPLNKPGGERRLNVAVTRAREKVVLITSIKGADIDSEVQSLGVQTLRTYLDYAEQGIDSLNRVKTKEGGFDSALDEDVANEIKKLGYALVLEVGCSGCKIDIGVLDPVSKGHYLLGVECDGYTYKSSSSARDRDRLREQVLRQLGWRIHRIWAPAWVARRDSEIRRLKEAIEQAQVQQIEQDSQSSLSAPVLDVQRNQYGGIEKLGVPYKVYPLKATYNPYIKAQTAKANVDSRVKNEFHFPENRENQTKLLGDLIANEGPLHFDYAVGRLAATWGIKQITPKINHAVKEALNNLLRQQKVTIKGSFLWPAGLKETPLRVPTPGVPESKRKPQYIAPEEVETAMKQVAQYALGISDDSLVAETAKVFGISHGGEEAKTVFSEVLKRLIRERKLVCREDGVVTIP